MRLALTVDFIVLMHLFTVGECFPKLRLHNGKLSIKNKAATIATDTTTFQVHSINPNITESVCKLNVTLAIDSILDRMRVSLLQETIRIANGKILIYDAGITHYDELTRLGSSCAHRLDKPGMHLVMPFETEIHNVSVAAKFKYHFLWTDFHGDYDAYFSKIRLSSSIEADLDKEQLHVIHFAITSSKIERDHLKLGFVPKFILDWIRSFFDNDNTQTYQKLAGIVLQNEVLHFQQFNLLRQIVSSAFTNEEDPIVGSTQSVDQVSPSPSSQTKKTDSN